MSTDPTGAGPADSVVRVVRGAATAEEVAAVVAALRVRGAARKPAVAAGSRPSRWVASGRPEAAPGWAAVRLTG